MQLDIYMRTCAPHGVPYGNVESSHNRICGNDREEMILKCVSSLVESANNVTDCIVTITVFDDHSPETFLDKLNSILSKCNHKTNIASLSEHGFHYSAFFQIKTAAALAQDLVYLVEDDYLHDKDSLNVMINAWKHFSTNTPAFKEVALFPYDCEERYGEAQPCRIFHYGDRYWRTTWASSQTVLMHRDTLRKYLDVFLHLATQYGIDGVTEANTINRLWNSAVMDAGPIYLFSPIPSTAVHLSYMPPHDVNTRMFDWKKAYDEQGILSD